MTLTTAALAIASGSETDATDLVSLLCGLCRAVGGTRLTIEREVKLDQQATLSFFNEASAAELQTVPFLGPALSNRIIEARGDEGFAAVEEILAVTGIRDDLIGAAARDVRDQFLEKKGGVE